MAAGQQCSEESPDSLRQRCRVTPGQGNLTESATENRPPVAPEVRQRTYRRCAKGACDGSG
ncbi:hypothetical protein EDD52_103158 [Primorskyibacter sedentarius]|uniref:Uncharacterized protein n=1 Tax=Primorskyibacter sedentarius TaxID=745311 RepID=A0A4V2UPF3_9RHOB|nr:hypothetical protein EDD52_103158 [Primorskyibacter sedentarius]